MPPCLNDEDEEYTVEYVVSYKVTSAGEVEDIEGRLRATSPYTLDVA